MFFFLFPYFWTISNITFGIVSKRETKNERRASIWIEYDPSFIKIELRFASCCGRALIPFEYVIKRGSHETNCKTAFRIKLHLNHSESNTEFGTMMMRNAMQMYKSVPIIYHLLTKKKAQTPEKVKSENLFFHLNNENHWRSLSIIHQSNIFDSMKLYWWWSIGDF